MPAIVSVNGVVTLPEEARISVLDHGFLFGDSVYETLRTYDGKPFLFSRHFDRLLHSAREIHFEIPWDRSRMRDEVQRALVAAANSHESRIRVVVTRGVGDLGPDPGTCHDPAVIIFVNPLVELPADVYENGVQVMMSSFHRNLQFADIKSGNLLRQVLAFREAKAAGAFEAILLTPEDRISDGITSNIYFVKGSALKTPSHDAGIVAGITRSIVLDLARRLNLDVTEGLFHKRELTDADEMFLTSTTREVVPITKFDGRPIGNGGPGPVTRRLLEAYRGEVKSLILEN